MNANHTHGMPGSEGGASKAVEHEHGCAVHYLAHAPCTCGVQGASTTQEN